MITSPTNEKEYHLLKTIKLLRKEMISLGIQEGLNSDKTLTISQKLDSYIAKYQYMDIEKTI